MSACFPENSRVSKINQISIMLLYLGKFRMIEISSSLVYYQPEVLFFLPVIIFQHALGLQFILRILKNKQTKNRKLVIILFLYFRLRIWLTLGFFSLDLKLDNNPHCYCPQSFCRLPNTPEWSIIYCTRSLHFLLISIFNIV